jgi:hypothetical protein
MAPDFQPSRPKKRRRTGPEGLLALSLPEIRHLITLLAWACIPDPGHVKTAQAGAENTNTTAGQHH